MSHPTQKFHEDSFSNENLGVVSFNRWTAILLGFLVALPFLADAQTLPGMFSSATENSTFGWGGITEKLAQELVSEDDRVLLMDTIAQEGLSKNYHQFFRSKRIRLSPSEPPAYFIRPAKVPYYPVFYGAHTFRFWVVNVKGKVLLSGSADSVSFLNSVHDGMRDIMLTQCRSGTCYNTPEVYGSGEYQRGSISVRTISD
jgi:hypothetical protein